jgi:hypothetical protein
MVSASYRISEFSGSALSRSWWRRRELLGVVRQRLRKEPIEREEAMRHGRCLRSADLFPVLFFVYTTKFFEPFG